MLQYVDVVYVFAQYFNLALVCLSLDLRGRGEGGEARGRSYVPCTHEAVFPNRVLVIIYVQYCKGGGYPFGHETVAGCSVQTSTGSEGGVRRRGQGSVHLTTTVKFTHQYRG